MVVECTYNDLTGNKPTITDCDLCHIKFDLPFITCCLNNCNDCGRDDCTKFNEVNEND